MSTLDRSGLPAPEETTLEGRVEILGDFPRGRFGDDQRVKHCGLLLKTDWGRLVVHLGPAGYFRQHNFQIRAGDLLWVTCIRVVRGQVPLIEATEVKNQWQRLRLRDKNGLPLWPALTDRML